MIFRVRTMDHPTSKAPPELQSVLLLGDSDPARRMRAASSASRCCQRHFQETSKPTCASTPSCSRTATNIAASASQCTFSPLLCTATIWSRAAAPIDDHSSSHSLSATLPYLLLRRCIPCAAGRPSATASSKRDGAHWQYCCNAVVSELIPQPFLAMQCWDGCVGWRSFD